MRMLSGVILAVTVAALSGCTGKTVLLKDSRGDLQKCEVSAGSTYLTGVIIRDMTIEQCIAEYRKAGYSPVGGP